MLVRSSIAASESVGSWGLRFGGGVLGSPAMESSAASFDLADGSPRLLAPSSTTSPSSWALELLVGFCSRENALEAAELSLR